jgi:hypothetical protein
MRTARQPTIKTWFLFVILFVIPLPWMTKVLGRQQPAAADQFVFAAAEFVPLAVALMVGLMCRRLWAVPLVCVAIRSAWQLLAWSEAFDGGLAWRYVVTFPLWPESITANAWYGSLPVGLAFSCANIYALAGILLAMTCRVREPVPKS